MHAESYKLFADAEAKNNPKNVCPIIVTTEEEKQKTETVRTNVNSYVSGMMTDFCTGKADINDDKVWNNYLSELDKLGLDTYVDYVQTAYDRG
jgi:putative aldouronate transport system substrate-binding protein